MLHDAGSGVDDKNSLVMPGLDPGIHPSSQKSVSRKMDHRVKPGDDDLNWYDGPKHGALPRGFWPLNPCAHAASAAHSSRGTQ
jgi:hypothetical protein